MIKAEFFASLLQSSVSHNPSEIIRICFFCAQETCIMINVENSCVCGNPEGKPLLLKRDFTNSDTVVL